MDEVRNDAGLTEKEFLEQYRPSDYERPSVTVDMLVLCMSKYLDNLKVLLIQRKDHPYINCWALAGGFVGIDESAYQAACRELREETGIESSTYLEQLYTMSRQEQPTVAGDDARKALWFDISLTKDFLELSNQDENIVIQYRLSKETFQNGVVRTAGYKMQPVSREKLAFDHCEIILEGLLRLRNKVTYSDIAFNLLPLEFTLPDLKKVYEVILGKELYKTNFKASVESKVEAIDHKIVSMTRGGKMAMGYRYKTEE